MSLINPIPDTNWLKNNKDNLRVSDEAYLELVQIYDIIDSIDWEYSRINDDATLIDKINREFKQRQEKANQEETIDIIATLIAEAIVKGPGILIKYTFYICAILSSLKYLNIIKF